MCVQSNWEIRKWKKNRKWFSKVKKKPSSATTAIATKHQKKTHNWHCSFHFIIHISILFAVSYSTICFSFSRRVLCCVRKKVRILFWFANFWMVRWKLHILWPVRVCVSMLCVHCVQWLFLSILTFVHYVIVHFTAAIVWHRRQKKK